MRQVVAYQLREMEEKSCSQTLYGYPYSQFAASIAIAMAVSQNVFEEAQATKVDTDGI